MDIESRCGRFGVLILAVGALPACFAWGIDKSSAEASSSGNAGNDETYSEGTSVGETPAATASEGTGSATAYSSSTDPCSCDLDYVWNSAEGEPFGLFEEVGSLPKNLDVDECCGPVTDVEITVAIDQSYFGNLTISLAHDQEVVLLVDPNANPSSAANTLKNFPLRFRGIGDGLSDREDIDTCWSDAEVICEMVCAEAVDCLFRPDSGALTDLYATGVAGRWTLTVDSSDPMWPARLYTIGIKLIP